MKKKLVVLLAVVMMFAFSASAYAATFSDVSDRPVVEQDAIKKAVALGIIEGYEDGTFGPDKTITRAEFAKIAVTAAGAKDTATMLEGNASSFKDVKANSWYTGWINAGESLGIFKGDANGNFRPNDTISNQEAITVLMRLLGYNDNLTGSWPVNYVTKANQIKMLDDVNIVASAAAKRGDITVMLDAALDTDIVTYDKDTNEFVKKQYKISDSAFITLLEDSFDGSFYEVGNTGFNPINQVRSASEKTLNWNVDYVYRDDDGKLKAGATTLIVDGDTAVSYNGGSLFDLEHHRGKIYFVTINDKKYARFVDVESYTKAVTDDVVYDNNNGNPKVTVLKTNLNTDPNGVVGKNGAANSDTVGTLTSDQTGNKWSVAAADSTSDDKKVTYSSNSNTVLYFNDDDQVYRIANDKEYTDKAYFVKSVGTNNVRLIGNQNKTVSMNDGDTLIYDGNKFIAPSDLEPGDALVEIAQGDLYVKTATISGELASTDRNDTRYKIAGKNYVGGAVTWLDEEYEDSGVATEDVVGNVVTVLLNKNNYIAAVLVDETSTGNTLYGVVVDNDSRNGTFDKNGTSSLTIFTEEGNTVTYDLDKDFDGRGLTATNVYGRLVAYKLNKNGEIKDLYLIIKHNDKDVVAEDGIAAGVLTGDLDVKGDSFAVNNTDKVEIKNNSYVTYKNETSRALASNATIFEVNRNNDGTIDVNLVSRSSFLNKSSFKVEQIILGSQNTARQYLAYDTNSNGAVKAMAYTKSSSDDLEYGIVGTWNFRSADYTNSITLKGDETVYELGNPSFKSGNGQLIAYTISGDEITVVYSFKKQGTDVETREVAGITSGLISFLHDELGKVNVLRNYQNPPTGYEWAADKVYDVMTDTNTLVFVIDATDGTYSEGTMSDLSRGDYAYVPVIDDEGYADVVIVDEYAGSVAALAKKTQK